MNTAHHPRSPTRPGAHRCPSRDARLHRAEGTQHSETRPVPTRQNSRFWMCRTSRTVIVRGVPNGGYTRRLGDDLAAFRDRLAGRVLASVGGRWVLELVAGQPRRGVAASVPAGGRAGPGGALADRAGEQVVQHLVWCGMHACAIPLTAACTVAGAESRRNTSGEVVVPPVKPRAHWAASGTCASGAWLCSSSQPAGRPGPRARAHRPAPIAP